jgi:TonB family protein
MQARKIQVAGLLLVLGGVGSHCMASECSKRPAPETVYSENNEFAVTFAGDRLAEPPASGPDAEDAAAVRGHRSRAFFYAAGGDDQLRLITDFALVNDPATGILSNDGQYLVTFDHRCPGEEDKDVVVIYRTDGSLVRSLSLKNLLTANDIVELSAWSTHWGGSHHIDEDKQLLVLRVPDCKVSGCIIPPICGEPAEVAIRLADGAPLRPARDLLPRLDPKVALHSTTERGIQNGRAHPDDPLCARQESFSRAREVPFDSLRRSATALEPPSYTEVARKARLQGSVILEILVEHGGVACVRTIKGLPMGLDRSARDAALRWRFSPSPDRSGSVRSVVAFDFSVDHFARAPAE